ncbi:MAG: class I SAM-dependent methyltransferase [Dehalococcoidales bacterium]
MYWPSYENTIDPVLKNIRQAMPEFAGMKPGDQVLDVCCGTGAQVIEYARYGIMATGIDTGETMIKSGIKNKTRMNLININFILADATALPFGDGMFDYVSVSFGIHDKDQITRNKIVSEMKRVVKPEGFLVFIDYQVPLPNNIPALLARIIERIAGGDHYRGFKDFLHTGGLSKILEDHHLKELKTEPFKSGVVVAAKARLNLKQE